MEHQAPAIFIALEESGFAAAIRQSLWIYPAANVGHIVALVCFAGAVAVMDIRLLGGFAATAPGRLLARARVFAIAALAGMAITGFVLFSAEASHLATNPVFQFKAALVGAGFGAAAVIPPPARISSILLSLGSSAARSQAISTASAPVSLRRTVCSLFRS